MRSRKESAKEYTSQLLRERVIVTSRFGATGYVWTNLVILNLGRKTRTTPKLDPPSPNFRTTLAKGRFTPTYDLTCNRPNTRRIFNGIEFRTWSPPAPKPRPYH
ncbi:hypothetical protein AVEN_96481-1 [Araneus ventricosus]|uniref:Uncharacterized protein n=1 Tax=Araneus ventricosus TaxID=182803 RepID=A0A4Y2CTU7_ARAVE|nr:hypothetical protein AVEN_96481-1 [Araneus ventricosus]